MGQWWISPVNQRVYSPAVRMSLLSAKQVVGGDRRGQGSQLQNKFASHCLSKAGGTIDSDNKTSGATDDLLCESLFEIVVNWSAATIFRTAEYSKPVYDDACLHSLVTCHGYWDPMPVVRAVAR